jgi:hypothetical protein
MATVSLIGADAALLEGLAQTLAAGGHRGRITRSIADAVEERQRARERVTDDEPLVVLLARDLAVDGARAATLLAAGGALVLYHAAGADEVSVPATVRRLMLADVALPLERHRLMTLIQTVEARARATGRGPAPPPTERAARMGDAGDGTRET